MRKKQYEITDPQVIEEILSRSEVCRIALIDNDRPYIVPLNYGYKNNSIYFHSSQLGKKVELLKLNNKVCFEIELFSQIVKRDNPCDWSTKYRSVIGYGTIEFIEDSDKKRVGLDIIMAHYGKSNKNIYNDTLIDKVLILKLKIEEISGKQSGVWK
ncbi:MAG: pyridoxamine 5'-phosphate oxidase family protein [Bacteroidales bacterium]|nr:pyridoxamine 5'-phosphate oxidase family protein [Bacteroidales bacterium]